MSDDDDELSMDDIDDPIGDSFDESFIVDETETDPTISGLFEQLDDDAPSAAVGGDTSPPLELKPNYDVDVETLPPASKLTVDDVRKVQPILPSSSVSTAVVVQPEPIVDIRKQFEQMDIVTDEILQGTRTDRQEAQDVIVLMRREIDKAISANQNPPRMYMDNIVKALEVKTTVNMTAVKVLEARAKMIAATKAGIVLQNNNQINNNNDNSNGGVDDSLLEVLSHPIGPDDEY